MNPKLISYSLDLLCGCFDRNRQGKVEFTTYWRPFFIESRCVAEAIASVQRAVAEERLAPAQHVMLHRVRIHADPGPLRMLDIVDLIAFGILEDAADAPYPDLS